MSDLAQKICSGDRAALAKAITLVESTRTEHQEDAAALLQTVMPQTGNSIRIGISGPPGVGKSTFIESLGSYITAAGENHRLAVLAVDPTSSRSGGSILGDKTRMQTLAQNPAVFIRPSPAGGTLGGVARRTRETLLLCEAAGFDVVIVETVGVGQSETAVAEMTDIFLLMLLPGGGDELQGIKRGIVELADLILVNKADGDQLAAAKRTLTDYRAALHLIHSTETTWEPKVVACSAREGRGIAETWAVIEDYQSRLQATGDFTTRRAQQAIAWMWQETREKLLDKLKTHSAIKRQLSVLEQAVTQGKIPPPVAAKQLIELFKLNTED